MTEGQYIRRVAYERDLGLSATRITLDELCERLGWDWGAWRYWPGARVTL